MPVTLQYLLAAAHELVQELDPDALSGSQARELVEGFVALERVAAAGKVLAIGRLDQTGAWVGNGAFRDLPAWLASRSGTGIGSSRATTETARRLRDLPDTTAALRAGTLSPVQADAVSAAAAADPHAESALIEHATSAGMKGLRTECQRIIAAASSELEQRERAERAHRVRALRHHQYEDGTGKIVVHGPLDRTAQIMAALEPHEQALFEEHRQACSPEHPDAIAFDALVRVCTRVDESAPPRKKGGRAVGVCVLHVSHDAYLRGFLLPGEICEIEGAGPVPVSAAHRIASDAVLRAVVTDGVDVALVSHLGRTIPAHLRTAVETLDRVCTIEGCEVDRHLEIDHNDPVAALGRTELTNLGRMCHHHHDLKTRRDLRRLGPRGRQRLVTRAEYEAAQRGPPVDESV